jgi:hypothetical protein
VCVRFTQTDLGALRGGATATSELSSVIGTLAADFLCFSGGFTVCDRGVNISGWGWKEGLKEWEKGEFGGG